MRRWLVLLLAAVLVLPAAACGRDYSTDLTGALGVGSFTMTEEDAALLEICLEYDTSEEELAALSVTEEELRGLADSLGMETGGEDDPRLLTFRCGHSYRFSDNGQQVDAVRYALPDVLLESQGERWEQWVDERIREWTESYGEPAGHRRDRGCTWYGSVGGERAALSVERGDGPSVLELERVK